MKTQLSRLVWLASGNLLLLAPVSSLLAAPKADTASETSLSITFQRKDYSHAGCLEYSWVPQGERRVIQLAPGVRSKTQVDTAPANLNASHVQVYVVVNGNFGAEMGQFPSGPPRPKVLKTALVDVKVPTRAADAVSYADGAVVRGFIHLDDRPHKCPTGS